MMGVDTVVYGLLDVWSDGGGYCSIWVVGCVE